MINASRCAPRAILSKMIKVGILGAGGMGNVHARQYKKMQDVEVCFFDLDPERADTFTKRWDIPVAESAEKLIATADLVDVCLPTDLHIEFGLKAIAAGKALFLEKPVARTFEDAIRLAKEADKANVPYMPGQVVRFFPEFSNGNRLVKEGAVGTPGAARMRRGGLAPTGSDSWFMDHSRSGGVLLDLAIHDFDWLRWTLGEVTQLTSRSIGAKTGHGPDYALTTISFDDGAIAHVESTWMDPSGFRTAFEVCGSKGMIEFDSRQTSTLRAHFPVKSYNESPLAAYDDPYYRQLSSFVTAVSEGGKPPVSGWDGAMAVGIALAALESARTGEAVRPLRV